MEVRIIGQDARSGDVEPLTGIDRLVELLGTGAFPDRFFTAARTLCGCAHLSTLVADDSGVRLVLAANEGPLPIARATAQKYVADYWRQDPINPLLGRLGKADALVRIVPGDIGSRSYRRDCYRAHGLVDRFTLLRVRAGISVRINLYRTGRAGPFSDRDVATMSGAAGLLLSLAAKHHDLSDGGHRTVEAGVRRRIALLAPDMPAREVQVCIGIAGGQTSEAIALSLGISANTVLTYRKRAYRRLRISSQNELMRLFSVQ